MGVAALGRDRSISHTFGVGEITSSVPQKLQDNSSATSKKMGA